MFFADTPAKIVWSDQTLTLFATGIVGLLIAIVAFCLQKKKIEIPKETADEIKKNLIIIVKAALDAYLNKTKSGAEANESANVDTSSLSDANIDATLEHALSDMSPPPATPTPEAVVLKYGRPAIQVEDDNSFELPQQPDMKKAIVKKSDDINEAVKSVGRIIITLEREGRKFRVFGTGWLIDSKTIVTNRHVAKDFANETAPFALKSNAEPVINFHPNGQEADYQVKITKCHYIDNQLDYAICEIEQVPEKLKNLKPITCEEGDAETLKLHDMVAVIGYPAKKMENDPDFPRLLREIFDDTFGVKKFAPGLVVDIKRDQIQHDCSTLAGNSGSVIISLTSGKAVALHFAGQYLVSNFAVPIRFVVAKYNQIKANK